MTAAVKHCHRLAVLNGAASVFLLVASILPWFEDSWLKLAPTLHEGVAQRPTPAYVKAWGAPGQP